MFWHYVFIIHVFCWDMKRTVCWTVVKQHGCNQQVLSVAKTILHLGFAPWKRHSHHGDSLELHWMSLRPIFCSQVARRVFQRHGRYGIQLKHWLEMWLNWNLPCIAGVFSVFFFVCFVAMLCIAPILANSTMQSSGGDPDPWESTGICPMACAVLPLDLGGHCTCHQCSLCETPRVIRCAGCVRKNPILLFPDFGG